MKKERTLMQLRPIVCEGVQIAEIYGGACDGEPCVAIRLEDVPITFALGADNAKWMAKTILAELKKHAKYVKYVAAQESEP